MSNSVFQDLMLRARKQGARKLVFEVDLSSFDPVTGHAFWVCTGKLEPHIPHLAHGRTGEEALRELVAFLERLHGPPSDP